MYLKALTGRMKLKGCTSMKDVTSHSHISGHFSNLRAERRKKMLKNLQRPLSSKTQKTGKLVQTWTLSGWTEFKRRTVNIKDELLRVQLSKLFEAASALSDSFAGDDDCQDDISNLHFGLKEAMHLQNLTYSEMKQMFLKKIDQIIFAEYEIQSLQWLLHEYRQTAREDRFEVGKLKSSCVKEVLIK